MLIRANPFQLWQEFFILAANIGSRQQEQGGTEDDDAEQYDEGEEEEEDAESTLSTALGTKVGQSSRRTDAADERDESSAKSFDSSRNARASSPARSNSRRTANRHQADEEPSWAAMESPFERLKKELAQPNAGDVSSEDQSMSQAEIALKRHRDRAQADSRRHEGEGSSQVEEAAHEMAKIHLTDLPMIRSPAKLRSRTGNSSGQTPRLLNRVLQSEQKKADANRAAVGESTPAAGGRSRSTKWDGLADLSKTPLSVRKGRTPARGGGKGGKGKSTMAYLPSSDDTLGDSSSDDSLAWPPGMSPPVTMRLSVPRSRFARTPAKEAAKILMDDLLRTAETQRDDGREESRSADTGESSSSRYASAVATPLKKGPLGRMRKEKRDSGSTSTSAHVVSHPEYSRKSTPVGGATHNRAAMLLDEGEDGDDSIGDGHANDLGDLTAGPRQTIHRTPKSEDEDSDSEESDEEESDDDDDDDDSDEDYTRTTRRPMTVDTAKWTDSSLLSRHGDNIDNDTLFGIGAGVGTGKVATATSVTQQPKSRGQSSDEFKLRGGQLEDTVRGGKLLEERDLTYSAPSPTPAPLGRRSGGGAGSGGI